MSSSCVRTTSARHARAQYFFAQVNPMCTLCVAATFALQFAPAVCRPSSSLDPIARTALFGPLSSIQARSNIFHRSLARDVVCADVIDRNFVCRTRHLTRSLFAPLASGELEPLSQARVHCSHQGARCMARGVRSSSSAACLRTARSTACWARKAQVRSECIFVGTVSTTSRLRVGLCK